MGNEQRPFLRTEEPSAREGFITRFASAQIFILKEAREDDIGTSVAKPLRRF